MKENLAGRVARMDLKPSKAFFPVFEAVSNAFDAIDASLQATRGRITIEITRDPSQAQLMQTDRVAPITSISVTDNGVGFTNDNYHAFDER